MKNRIKENPHGRREKIMNRNEITVQKKKERKHLFPTRRDRWSCRIIQFAPSIVTRGGRAPLKSSPHCVTEALLLSWGHRFISAEDFVNYICFIVCHWYREKTGVHCNLLIRWYHRRLDTCTVSVGCKNLPASTQSDRVSFSSTSYQPLSAPQRCNCITQQAG